MLVQESFFQWHIGNVIELGGFGLAGLGYFLSRKTEIRERREGMLKAAQDREISLTAQIKMHTENSEGLASLLKFQEQQMAINLKRDEDITQLTTLAAASAEMVRGLDRRLQLIENR